MAFGRLHEEAQDDPKLLALSDPAWRMWGCGVIYCQKHLTDGFIPEHIIHTFGVRHLNKRKVATSSAPSTCQAGRRSGSVSAAGIRSMTTWTGTTPERKFLPSVRLEQIACSGSGSAMPRTTVVTRHKTANRLHIRIAVTRHGAVHKGPVTRHVTPEVCPPPQTPPVYHDPLLHTQITREAVPAVFSAGICIVTT